MSEQGEGHRVIAQQWRNAAAQRRADPDAFLGAQVLVAEALAAVSDLDAKIADMAAGDDL